MTKVYQNPPQSEWQMILARPASASAPQTAIKQIFDAIQAQGDVALVQYSAEFDKFAGVWPVSEDELLRAGGQLSEALKSAIEVAYQNIKTFHEAELPKQIRRETMAGVVCERRAFGIERVGLYIPGGTAPLFSTVLMLGIPALLAGCEEVVLCTPPQSNGAIHPTILYAAARCGIKKIFKIGGAQAIASMALGTATVPQCYKIFGPGNQWVTSAKQYANGLGVAIDMPAGPSEVLVLADAALPAFVAADLLAQAEHGNDSQVMLVTTNPALPEQVLAEMDRQLKSLPRAHFIQETLKNSCFLLFENKETAIEAVNFYAPEHLIVQSEYEDWYLPRIRNAGSVFIGQWSPESVGDYASGTNHTLPTSGFAKAWSGVSVESFMKFITFQTLSAEGLIAIGPVVEEMAAAESLDAHARAVSIRLAFLNE